MNQIFTGLLLIFIDLHFNLGNASIDLLPDFLGYLLIVRGCAGLTEHSLSFQKARSASPFLAACTGFLFGLQLFSANALGLTGLLLELVAVVGGIFVSFQIVRGVQETEQAHGWDLRGDRLRSLWLAQTVLQGMVFLLSWIPVLGTVAAIAGIIVTICFLAAFYRSMKRYAAETTGE